MSLAKEVAVELRKMTAQSSGAPELRWWQRLVLIAAANAIGVLIGGGLIAFFSILWQKSNATDDIYASMKQAAEVRAAERQELLNELASLRATQARFHVDADAIHGPFQPGEDLRPEPAPVAAEEVDAAKEAIQQKIDKAVYRARQLQE